MKAPVLYCDNMYVKSRFSRINLFQMPGIKIDLHNLFQELLYCTVQILSHDIINGAVI
jgi:hypothetical protein